MSAPGRSTAVEEDEVDVPSTASRFSRTERRASTCGSRATAPRVAPIKFAAEPIFMYRASEFVFRNTHVDAGTDRAA
jgi:hypothetical protein